MKSYLRFQTNRVKIKEIIALFSRQAISDEYLIVPRPLPKTNFRFYVGFSKVESGSENYKMLILMKNHMEISEEEYMRAIESIKYFWEVKKKAL